MTSTENRLDLRSPLHFSHLHLHPSPSSSISVSVSPAPSSETNVRSTPSRGTTAPQSTREARSELLLMHEMLQLTSSLLTNLARTGSRHGIPQTMTAHHTAPNGTARHGIALVLHRTRAALHCIPPHRHHAVRPLHTAFAARWDTCWDAR